MVDTQSGKLRDTYRRRDIMVPRLGAVIFLYSLRYGLRELNLSAVRV